MRRIAAIALPLATLWSLSFKKAGSMPLTWPDQPLDNTKPSLARTVIVTRPSHDTGATCLGLHVKEDHLVSLITGAVRFDESILVSSLLID